MSMDVLINKEIKQLNTKILGKNIIFYETIDSTQSEVWRRIEKNDIENGTIIIASIQTGAIGTHGRKWYTEKPNNIAFSIFIKTNCEIEKLEGLTTLIAEIFIKIFKEKYNINLGIKSPNDIVFNNKKIGGILTQTKVNKGIVKCIVIGIGINTNQEKFCKEIEKIATSIKKEFNISIDNKAIITRFCELFEDELIKNGIIKVEN